MSILSSRNTPLDDSYPSCVDTDAALAIYNIDPDLVSQKIGIVPTRSRKKGVTPILSQRAAALLKNYVPQLSEANSWILESEDHVKSKDLRKHLDWLLDQIEPAAKALVELQRLPEAKMAVRCVWFGGSFTGGPTLWPEQMKRLAQLNLECNFSWVGAGDDEEEADSNEASSSKSVANEIP